MTDFSYWLEPMIRELREINEQLSEIRQLLKELRPKEIIYTPGVGVSDTERNGKD